MGDCLENLFVQQFDSFMAEHGYKQNINCFTEIRKSFQFLTSMEQKL